MIAQIKKMYIDLDRYLPLHTLPNNIVEAIGESYDLIKQNTWQKTTKLNGDVSNCNWQSKESRAKESSQFFEIEVKNRTVAPMWILDLSIDLNKNSKNLYDSIENSSEDWDNIYFRKDLPTAWDPFLEWVRSLYCFNQIGRTSLLLTRPGVPPQYHRDIGVGDESYKPYSHRQEFIWLKITDEKTLFILDENRNPTQVESRSAFFNHHNWHGSHKSLPYWSFSFKIEGVFSEKFRKDLNLDGISSYG